MTVYTTMDSPLGPLLLVGRESPTAKGGTALAALSLPGQKNGAVVQDGWREDPDAFREIGSQLRSYFEGGLTSFDIEYVPGGTDFRQRVWKALEDIPYGTTLSYGEIAARIGASRAAVRAVGTAIGANPLLVVRPCHRVIGANGALTGYAAGLERKRLLLDLENVPV
ncbi:methylated-DNA--[protein]-cysteine S-methyltransferase [Streptomyces sp. NBC_01281]|jgi:methylated-DNA-[protein]-cysteine S-methyltransferase|uniref:methylated-DNA--[protein]-cysteine S-methyltransferase n=1 Tax=unclassified Streptomyces TaxID=2593676 RepID=UPI0013B74F8C|nr:MULTISPECIES: methylated-DNA--[protein]-cysteine S-methyltransferase [unclassified Streptomyces]MCX4918357.1 methylated-DNA--[protein]-cysteine S-methyltransferase [Streptomyces sp. NBC_00687]NEB29698.1 methylated-DNA--[protein]-cysteine S-methyltransferase [Streptomyces sp. SID14446]WSK59815.1 methylated-DNA--[protein]-cysteine S-methyltransferase [Streptomyces sp. NBC_01281]